MISVRKGEIVIHTSDRIMFRRCRRKAYYASNLWLGLRPVRPNSTLWLGTGVHKAIEMYYGYGDDMVQTFLEWSKEGLDKIKKEQGILPQEYSLFNEVIDTGIGVLRHYFKFAQRYDDFSVHMIDGKPAVEVMFKVPIYHPGTKQQLMVVFDRADAGMTEEQLDSLRLNGYVEIPVYYGGRFDMIVEDTFGDLWIMDHKTAKTFADWSKLSIDTQVGSYIWAAEQSMDLDRHINGVIYNGLKKTAPSKPEQLKKGGLSKNKSQNTTYELYLEAIEELGLDPSEYKDILEHLRGQVYESDKVIESKYFRREKVKRTRDEIGSIAQDIYYEALDMIQAGYMYPNPTRDCSWDCDFKDLCRALYNNEDVEYMLDSMYEPRPEEEDEFSVYAAQGGE